MVYQALPLTWGEISPEEKKRIKAAFPVSMINDLIRYENGMVMPRAFTKIADKLYNFPLREDDIWIVTYPKTGTTWTQETVWMLVNDVDKEAGNVPQVVRSPFLEASCVMSLDHLKSLDMQPDDPILLKVIEDPIEYAKNMTGRRVLKTHLPMEFLPPKLIEKCKVIYVARNPKDTAVSYYKHNVTVPGHGLVGTFEDFITFFEEGLHVFGSYWHHVLSGWKEKDHSNVKFLWFEDMKKDQKAVIEELCRFLDHPLSPGKIDALVSHVKFENMSKNPMANPLAGLKTNTKFMRKGEVGDWKNFFTSERSNKWNQWIKENTEGTGLEKLKMFMES
eukprot:GFUD01007883.1.p1 GENE.GFUD01007883.1~~GFUD01007883.1.p1  ORF type:complete len:334 (-),score=84.53 GFUD01007883.1:170-1171(-)